MSPGAPEQRANPLHWQGATLSSVVVIFHCQENEIYFVSDVTCNASGPEVEQV